MASTMEAQPPLLPVYPSHEPMSQPLPTISTATTATTHRPVLTTLNTKSSTSTTSSLSASTSSPLSSGTLGSRKSSRSQPKPNHPTLNTSLRRTSATTRTFPASFTAPKSAVMDPSSTSLGGFGPAGTPTSPTNSYGRKFSAFSSPTSPASGPSNAEAGFLATVRQRNPSVASPRSPTGGGPSTGTFVRKQSNVGGRIATTMTYSNFADSPTSAVLSIDERIAAATTTSPRGYWSKKMPTAQVTEIVTEGGAGMAPARDEIVSPGVRELRGSVSSGKNGEGKRRASAMLLAVKDYLKPGPGSPTTAR